MPLPLIPNYSLRDYVAQKYMYDVKVADHGVLKYNIKNEKEKVKRGRKTKFWFIEGVARNS